MYPILAYGHPLLRQKGKPVHFDREDPEHLINAMWQTMRRANGCGLAANQVKEALQLFIVDSRSTYQQLNAEARKTLYGSGDTGIEEVFINTEIINKSDDTWTDEEGCLSIPLLVHPVTRSWSIEVRYLDKNGVQQQKKFNGTTARMIQHEYDHTRGILYVDYLNPVARKLLESKLKKIRKGQVKTSYPMQFYQ